MPQKVLRFTGINRKVNEFQESGGCDELINLRPDITGGHSVVKAKLTVKSGVNYDGFYEHSYGNVRNMIAVTDGVVEWVDLYFNNATLITDEFASKKVSISYAGNVLLIYCEEDKKQLVFKFEDDAYVPYDVQIKPIIGVEVNCGYSSSEPATNSAVADDSSVEACNAAMYKAASGFYGKYPNGLCGAAVIGCTYELDDESEVWSTAFITANVTREYGYIAPTLNENLEVTVTGASSVSLRLYFDETISPNIKKINIYASRPVFQFEMENLGGTSHRITQLPLEDVGLDGQLMYYQGSVVPDAEYKSFKLDFGQDQAGDSLMNITSGCIERTGMATSYNNRFHFYRSKVQHIIQVPTVAHLAGARDEAPYWVPFIKFNGKWERVNKAYKFSGTLPNDFIYPMAGVEQIAFIETGISESSIITSTSNTFYVDMKTSSAYNYSFAFDVTPSIVEAGELYDILVESGQHIGGTHSSKVHMKDEVNTINVSAPFNPYVFPVEHSYSFGGEIIDISTSYLPISSTQVGQYPITVFTTNGIYALEQGSGIVLYGAIVPLQPHVISGKATATPHGTFFTSSKNLYLLSGREAVNVSYVLNGDVNHEIVETDAYKKLCCGADDAFYNFSRYLSEDDFGHFTRGATMIYDQLNNELYISNFDYDYSYVFNLNTKQYHKVDRRFKASQASARYVIEIKDNVRKVVDMHEETRGMWPIMLQSRPLSLSELYTHIHRLILHTDATLSGDQYLCLSVFASDNLHDWKCIISSQKRGVSIRQIRTNRAAKSYRDYVILITGNATMHTDIADIIADYTEVNRRLG